MITINEESRHCHVFKAKNNMWYLAIDEPTLFARDRRTDYNTLYFGPFPSAFSAKRFLKDSDFADTSGVFVDNSGSLYPPKKSGKYSKIPYLVNNPYFIGVDDVSWEDSTSTRV